MRDRETGAEKMKRMMRFSHGLAAALVAVAIGAGQPAQAQSGSSLAGTSWRLIELNGQPPVSGAETPTLQFAADGSSVSGTGGCNQFSGAYTQNGTSLSIGPLAYTRLACGDPAGNTQETAYFQALESTTRYSIERGQLVLYSGDQVVARFRRGG
jgi:heat shock protein HslJ